MPDPIIPAPPSTEPPPPVTSTEPAPSGQPPELGDPGKAALDAERAARRDADKRSKKLEDELTALKTASLGDQERAIAEASAKATSETEIKWRDRVLAAEVRALAAGRAVDADLVAQLIDKTKLTWDGDELDSAAIAVQIDAVLAKRPYLAKPGNEPPPPPPANPPPPAAAPTVPGGPRGGGEQPDPGSMSMEQFREWRKANA
jgi:hypothetical protein